MPSNRQHFGYATLCDPEGMKENDTFTCAHCNQVVHIPPRKSVTDKEFPGGTCANCGHQLICLQCVAVGDCTPFLKTLERIEAQDRFRRQLGV